MHAWQLHEGKKAAHHLLSCPRGIQRDVALEVAHEPVQHGEGGVHVPGLKNACAAVFGIDERKGKNEASGYHGADDERRKATLGKKPVYHAEGDAVVILIAEADHAFRAVAERQQLLGSAVQGHFAHAGNFGKHEHALCALTIGGHGGHDVFKGKMTLQYPVQFLHSFGQGFVLAEKGLYFA